MAHLFISAAHKSSGKTTLSVGLSAALAQRGHKVQTFKKGPDFIDPLWLGRASRHPCYNLDFNTQSHDEITSLFAQKACGAEISLIEANKGLFDGLDLEGADSNAALATLLDAPIILIADVKGLTRGIAPLILGYQAFGADLNIAGVILNKVGGARHEGKLRAVLQHYTDVPVLGAVGFDEELLAPERHLGLVPPNEHAAADRKIEALRCRVEDAVDVDRLIKIAQTAPARKNCSIPEPDLHGAPPPCVKIGIAQDPAFGFYYADDLEALQAHGAELVPINMLRDPNLPDIDGLFIGGGFPETQMQALAANRSMRAHIKSEGAAGLPIYAECGGLMYLSRGIHWNEQYHDMVGLIPGDTVMHARPQGRGLVILRETGASPWPISAVGDRQTGDKKSPWPQIKAHEFHHATLENLPKNSQFAYGVERGAGITGTYDGYATGSLLASFTHLRATGTCHWVEGFIKFVRNHNSENTKGPW